MKEKYIVVREEYLNKKETLMNDLQNIKKICNENIKYFENKLRDELNEFKNNHSKEEILKKKRNLNSELSYYKKEEKIKISEIKKEIFNQKEKYKFDINEIWKVENQKKVRGNEQYWTDKIEKINSKFEIKIDKIEKKFNHKIDINNHKIVEYRSGEVSAETNFIDDYNHEEDYFESEIIAIKNYNKINKIKNNIRFCKKSNRKLSDEMNLRLLNIKKKQSEEISKVETKHEESFEFNKPGSKFWWSKQTLTSLNKGVAKLDQQRHMYAIKTSLIFMMPYTLVAAFWILLNSVILSTSQGGLLYAFGIKETVGLTNFKSIGGIVNNATLGIMGMALSICIASVLGDRYKFGKIESGLVGLSAFMMFTPIINGTLVTDSIPKGIAGMFLSYGELGATSMFLAILTGLLGIELYGLFLKPTWLKIKMPKQVPSAVAKSFNVIIPFLLVTFVFAAMSFSLLFFTGKNVKELIEIAVQKPLSSGIESLGGAMLIRIIADGLWVLGIHGQNMIGPIVGPVYLEHLIENADLVAAGKEPIWIVTSTFMDSYTLPMNNVILLISIFIFSKRKDHLSIMLVAFIPALFNISEPVIFGLPVVLNPILAIPLVLGSQVVTVMAYLATDFGWVTPLYVMTPWTTPSLIGPYIASGGDIRALILALAIFVVGIGIFAPFIIVTNIQAKQFNPDVIVSRFSIKNKLLFKRKEAHIYLDGLESQNKIIKKIKNKK